MKNVIFLPGLGADQRLFDFIEPGDFKPHYFNWMKVRDSESMESYLLRMKESLLHIDNPILVGVSLGGIMAVELREIMSVKKTILISSIKSKDEMPGYFELIKKIKLNELVPGSLLKKGAPLIKPFITKGFDKTAIRHFTDMLHDADEAFISWGIEVVLNWKRINSNEKDIVHIHGTSDIVFPIKNIRQINYIIKGGTHDMVMTSAGEVNEILRKEIA